MTENLDLLCLLNKLKESELEGVEFLKEKFLETELLETEFLETEFMEICFENPEVVDMIEELTYLKQCKIWSETDYLMAEIEYGDGNCGAPTELMGVLRDIIKEV